MKSLTTKAIAALVAATIGAVSYTPFAYADDSAAPQNGTAMQHPGMHHPGQPGGMRQMWMHRGALNMGQHGDLLDLACSPRGGEALEVALVHVKYTVDLTAEQTPLFDTLHDAAVADQKTFADACKAAMGNPGDAAGKSTLDRFQSRLDIEKAKLAAITDLMPKFKAFYDSLTDAQKAKLDAEHRAFGQDRSRPWADRDSRPGRPGDTRAQPPAPADSPVTPTDDTSTPT